MKTLTPDVCPHRLSRDPESCWSCAKDELLHDLPDVAAAVTAQRGSAVRDIRVKGGSPNWGLIDEQAASFTQDIIRDGNRFLGRDVAGVVAVINAVHQLLEVRPGAGHLIVSWRDECRQITGASDRPYPLTHAQAVTDRTTGDDDQPRSFTRIVAAPTLCPVVDVDSDQPCGGRLKVHPSKSWLSTGEVDPGHIVCSRDRMHTWSRRVGWLRLSLLLKKVS